MHASDGDRRHHLVLVHKFPSTFDFFEPYKFQTVNAIHSIQKKKTKQLKIKKKTIHPDDADPGMSTEDEYASPLALQISKRTGFYNDERNSTTWDKVGRYQNAVKGSKTCSIPCRSFASGIRCTYGDKCRYLHSVEASRHVDDRLALDCSVMDIPPSLGTSSCELAGCATMIEETDNLMLVTDPLHSFMQTDDVADAEAARVGSRHHGDDDVGDLMSTMAGLKVTVPKSISFGRRRGRGFG